MAEGPVNFLLEKLARFVENEMQLLRGDREEFLYLRGELRAFLKVADELEEVMKNSKCGLSRHQRETRKHLQGSQEAASKIYKS
ncbi:hypothetical protein CJ030_MR0G001900 [Morella rubra]|uniref:Rx N-terminal domain-containing protein n=1 Tax=Morella rubra TaxID=262757 RepID=A0A6A1UMM2_9ROSI|nr:hypothetical protein CJ030_MR0G001900 [Morella rubra]